MRAKVRVVLPMGDVDRIFQQFFDALVDQSSRAFRDVGPMFLSFATTQLQHIARHLPTNPVPVVAPMHGDQSAGVTGLRALEVLAFLVGKRVCFHDGHRLPVFQNSLRSRQVKAICSQRQRGAKLCLKFRASIGCVSEQCRPDRWTRSLNRPWRVPGRLGRALLVLVAAHSESNDGHGALDTTVRLPEARTHARRQTARITFKIFQDLSRSSEHMLRSGLTGTYERVAVPSGLDRSKRPPVAEHISAQCIMKRHSVSRCDTRCCDTRCALPNSPVWDQERRLRRCASCCRHSVWLIDRAHDTARGPGGPCSVAARSISRHCQRQAVARNTSALIQVQQIKS